MTNTSLEDDGEKTLRTEAQAVLATLDHLAEVWGDEGVFRRCRDRLRAAINTDLEDDGEA